MGYVSKNKKGLNKYLSIHNEVRYKGELARRKTKLDTLLKSAEDKAKAQEQKYKSQVEKIKHKNIANFEKIYGKKKEEESSESDEFSNGSDFN
jgi:phage host-nuclease inhibitor protein Gam